MAEIPIPEGYAVPLVDLTTKRLPAPTMDVIADETREVAVSSVAPAVAAASQSASRSAGSARDAETALSQAVQARNGANDAAVLSEAARSGAVAERRDAQLARVGAEDAQLAAEEAAAEVPGVVDSEARSQVAAQVVTQVDPKVQAASASAKAASDSARDAGVAAANVPAAINEAVNSKVPAAVIAQDIPGKVGAAIAAQAGKVITGTGSPLGVVSAPVGTLYVDTAKTLGAVLWRKDTGTGSTGWIVVDGDTGDRNLTTTLTNGWTEVPNQPLQIKRVGNLVSLRGYLNRGSAGLFSIIPVGFRPAFIHAETVPYGLATPTPNALIEITPAGGAHIYGTSVGIHYISIL